MYVHIKDRPNQNQRFNSNNFIAVKVQGLTDKLLINGSFACMTEGGAPYGMLSDGALAIKSGKIDWVGAKSELPAEFQDYSVEDLNGRLVTPAFIDCHTHLVFGGNRAREFELRLQGASYEEIARQGGGIVSTVRQTRAMSEAELVNATLPRLDALLAEGITTIEIKSGYGLSIADELKMLRAARRLEAKRKVRIKTTFLGAHAIPVEYKDRADDYISEVCLPALDLGVAEGLIDAVDAFCEGIGFSPEQVERVFKRATEHDIPVKIHAEQLSNLSGAALAARFGALSADHLEYLDQAGAEAMAKAGTVAVILPGAFYFLRETKMPPIDILRQTGVPMALATDCNPGSSPLTSLLLTLNMATTIFRLTVEEALNGVTREAAKALGLQAETGTLEAGKSADISVWNVSEPAELAYRIGFNPLHKSYFRGLL